jgi:hypothetical protein
LLADKLEEAEELVSAAWILVVKVVVLETEDDAAPDEDFPLVCV